MLIQFFMFIVFPAAMLEKFYNKKWDHKLSGLKFFLYGLSFLILITVMMFGKPITLSEFILYGSIVYGFLFLAEIVFNIFKKKQEVKGNIIPLLLSMFVLIGWCYYAYYIVKV